MCVLACVCLSVCSWIMHDTTEITSLPDGVWCYVSLMSLRYSHIDLIFLNAGVMPVAGMKLSRLWPLTPR